MEYSSPGLVLESVLEYRRAILVLGLDLRLPVGLLGLDSYSRHRLYSFLNLIIIVT